MPHVRDALLFQPGRIGTVTLRNRVVMPPMTTRLADPEGFVTDASIGYFRTRAAGGVGLVTVEMASPQRGGRHRGRELGIYDDKFIAGLQRLTAAIHAEGAKASIQLGHAGGRTRRDVCGEQPVAPTAMPQYVFEVTGATIVPDAMTIAQIAESTKAFVDAARRAACAGFDCVEIHAAHGYLFSQFLCPEENRRTDAYGGSLENRARFALEVTRAIRAAVPQIGLVFRLSVDDLFANGLQLNEGLQVAEWAERDGADAISVSAGHYRSIPSAQIMTPPMSYPDAMFLGFAAQVKKRVGVPVIAVGRLGKPEVAIEAVESGSTDFVALGRTLIADPDWPNKVAAGQPIRPCLACNTCVNEMRNGSQLGCVVNGAAARETEFAGAVAAPGRRIAVIGSGPAGLTYAHLVAPGNRVVVFERKSRSGGAFRYAGKAPLFQDVEAGSACFDYYLEQMERACRESGVEFRFGSDPLKESSALTDFDLVVIATGAQYPAGLGPMIEWLLDRGAARLPGIDWLTRSPRVRNWFYYRARSASGPAAIRALGKRHKVIVLGDASAAGKSQQAIGQAFRAALLDPAPELANAVAPTPLAVSKASTTSEGVPRGI